ncbi:hypothetical protein D3C76_1202400 [compost metagenome]
MAPRLQPLRDDGVGAMLRQPDSLRDRGRAGQHPGAPGFHAGKQRGRGQTKVKANHGGLELGQDGGLLRTEGGSARHTEDGIGSQPELGIIRRELLSPTACLYRVWLGLTVTEEVDVERLATLLEYPQCLAQLGRAEHGGWQGAEPPGGGNRQWQGTVLHPRHGGLNDGIADPELGEQRHAPVSCRPAWSGSACS